MSTDRFNEQHSRPRNLTGGTLYAVRTPARQLRQGDRVKDLFHAPFASSIAPRNDNYPGAHAYGTIVEGPKLFGSVLLAHVQFDDGFDGWLRPDDLNRI